MVKPNQFADSRKRAKEWSGHKSTDKKQPHQSSNVLETPKSNISVDPVLNSGAMMHGDENQNELQRIED